MRYDPRMDIAVLAKRLRVYRAEHHVTQIALARRLGISQTALSLLENGKPCPQLTDEKLAHIQRTYKQVIP